MNESAKLSKGLSKDEYKANMQGLRKKLAGQQNEVKTLGMPVIIVLEGWSAAGKGGKMAEIIRVLDPRNYSTYSTLPASADELRKPFLWRHWARIPAKGRYAIFDRSWYPEASTDFAEKKIDRDTAHQRLDAINTFERQLTDDGTLIIKIFLHISQDEQKKRLDKLAKDSATAWRVVEADYTRNRHYYKLREAYSDMLCLTNTQNAPWHVVSGQDKRSAKAAVMSIVVSAIDAALEKLRRGDPPGKLGELPKRREELSALYDTTLTDNFFMAAPDVLPAASAAAVPAAAQAASPAASVAAVPAAAHPVPQLKDINLESAVLSEKEYKKRLDVCRAKLEVLHNAVYARKIPVIIAYEGWDAAGKGGNIKRLTSALDPRGYEVIPIAAPSPTELKRPFLWRFWNAIPKDGHIAIFDRTWYGRVLVERVEGFAREDEWRRAYGEINEFEEELTRWGAVIVKFWLQIDKDEQLRRFTNRQQVPEKNWKITDDDWRNREKWDLYEEAVNDMLRETNTAHAPWHVIESQDKRYARIKAMETVIHAIS